MRAAVIGGGAMGGALAAEAAQAGHHVTIVDVSVALVDRINAVGVTVESGSGDRATVPVPAATDPGQVGPVDLVVVFVKGYHTAAAARTAQLLSTPDTTVLTLQNGWGNADILAQTLPAERLTMGVTYHSCTAEAPGVVRHTGRGPTVVGPYRADSPLEYAERSATFLTGAGWPATASGDVRTEIWRKLVLNAATLPTAALSGLPAGEVETDPDLRALVDALAAEAVAVAHAQGLALELDERLESIHAVLRGAGSGRPSMLQDVQAHRRTEIATVNAAVVRAGLAHGVPTPLNQAMVALVGGVERSWRL